MSLDIEPATKDEMSKALIIMYDIDIVWQNDLAKLPKKLLTEIFEAQLNNARAYRDLVNSI